MNLPVITLAALMAIIPLSSSAQSCWVTTGSSVVEKFGELIEGTGSVDTINCSGSDTRHDIYGYGGDDILIGSDFDDLDSPHDFIAGGGGKDTIYGGDGDDAIDGGASDDLIYGEDGNDTIFGGVGASPASGVTCELQTGPHAAGSSYLTKGGSGDDTIHGGEGDDCINAGSGEDVVYGGAGYDTIFGGNHSDLLDGGSGGDFIDGGWHTDTCVNPPDGDEYHNCESYVTSAPFCGDGVCDIGDDLCTCEDCVAPPTLEPYELCADTKDNDCDGDIDCADTDCVEQEHPSCSSSDGCGDGMCRGDEDCFSCPDDCSGKQKGKLSRQYCCGDAIPQPAEGNGSVCDGNY